MVKKKNSMYHRLDKSERVAIERGLDKRRSYRQIAKDLGRSQSTIMKEIERNRTIAKGKIRVSELERCQKKCVLTCWLLLMYAMDASNATTIAGKIPLRILR